jgi:hypothetical protein
MPSLSLFARLGLDATSFNVGLKRASSQTKAFSHEFNSHLKSMVAGAFGVAAIEEAIRRSVEYASKVRDTAAANTISTDAVQEFGFAAKQTSARLEDFTTSLKRLAVARDEALGGGAGGAAMEGRFKRLGVSIADLKTLRLEDLLLKIGDAFHASAAPQELMADGIKIMGRNATAVFPAMREGLRELMEEAKNAGNVIDESTINSLARLGDEFMVLKGRALAGFAEGLAELVRFIGDVAVGLEKIIAQLAAAAAIASRNPKAAGRRAFEMFSGIGLIDKKLGGGLGDALFGKTTDADALGAQMKEAADRARLDIVAREMEQRRLRELADLRRKEGRGLPLDFAEATAKAKTKGMEMGLDSLSKIGGFSQGAAAILRSLNERIASATESTAQSVERIVRLEEEG